LLEAKTILNLVVHISRPQSMRISINLSREAHLGIVSYRGVLLVFGR